MARLTKALIFIWFISIVYGAPYPVLRRNSSTRERHEAHEMRVQHMYQTVLPCLRNNPIVESKRLHLSLEYPEDAEAHYREILNKTKPFRQYGHHRFGGYRGPWIEKYFMKRFKTKPLSYFNGLIPLFVQWVENDLHTRITHNHLFDVLRRVLRKNVAYVLVSQSNNGVYQLADEFPNILMFSAGGYGHIPIPLIKSYMSPLPVPLFFPIDMGFYGDEKHGGRGDIFKALDRHSVGMVVRKGKSMRWVADMGDTKFNLAPAGFGPTSFRLAEIVQLGRVPVHISNDLEWLPYKGTPASVESIGYVGVLKAVDRLLVSLRNASDSDILMKLHRVHQARHHYTYDGLLGQMELFFKDPLGRRGEASYLRCERVPRHDWLFWYNAYKKRIRQEIGLLL